MNKEQFTNQNEVRWCPGCGDYAILAALQKTLPSLGLPPEKHVFVSGIGCSGRLPYYMNTYGFHTIHGRATAVASGLKLTRPDLCVWVITGDGDGLSIGAGHLMHLLRRNINVNILLFNNQVYGLTKGQFSPTSVLGQITKTSPDGVHQQPVNPIQFALGAEATFVARSLDKDTQHLAKVLEAAYLHQGCSFVEIYQDCHVFNPGAFDSFSAKTQRAQHALYLEQDKPMLFAEGQSGLSMNEQGVKKTDVSDASVHQESNFTQAMQLARLSYPEYPVPIGVFYKEERPVMDLNHQTDFAGKDLQALYRKGACWTR